MTSHLFCQSDDVVVKKSVKEIHFLHMLNLNDYPLFSIFSEKVIFDVNIADRLRISSSRNDSIHLDFNPQNVIDKLTKDTGFTKSLFEYCIVSQRCNGYHAFFLPSS